MVMLMVDSVVHSSLLVMAEPSGVSMLTTGKFDVMTVTV